MQVSATDEAAEPSEGTQQEKADEVKEKEAADEGTSFWSGMNEILTQK